MASPLELAQVPASIDNPGDWDPIMQGIARQTGLPPTITADAVLGMVRGAVPLIFQAECAGNVDVLRGTFADPVVAQCRQNLGSLLRGRPEAAAVHLVGGRVTDGDPVLRVHVLITGQGPGGDPTLDRQFWDLRFGGRVTVGRQECPHCGAPLPHGELICDHCGTDVRSTVDVPLVVSHLELY